MASSEACDAGDAAFSPAVCLVTGGAGFIGSHVLTTFVRRYPRTRWICFDALTYAASMQNLAAVAEQRNFTFIRGDLNSLALLRYLLRTWRVDAVLHFAAETHVDYSFHNSLAFTRANVLGTHTLLEACREYGGVERFLHVSTDEVYGDERTGLRNDELTLPAPTNPYSCSKLAAETMARGYYRSFGLPVLITRSNNVYGPRQYPDKLIPKTVRLLARGRKCYVHGTGEHVRSWLYVDDAVAAFDILLRRGNVGEVYNVTASCSAASADADDAGGTAEKSTLQVVRDIFTLMASRSSSSSSSLSQGCDYGRDADDANKDAWLRQHVEFVADRAYNDRRYALAGDKLRALGWRARVPWTDGLRRTVAWYRDERNFERWDAGEVEQRLVAHPRGSGGDDGVMTRSGSHSGRRRSTGDAQ